MESTSSIPSPSEPPELLAFGSVHLDVTDGARSLAFWRDLVGLEELSRSDDEIRLGVADRELIVLHPGAVRGVQRGHAGLYHVAIHLPSAAEFARVIARLAVRRVPQAPTDHVFSQATYVSDPDGLGLELTLETPERFGGFELGPPIVIYDSEGRPHAGTEPLDVEEVFRHLRDDDVDRPLPRGTTVGHVHLHVNDLAAGWRFYRDAIGFLEHMYMPSIGMADLSAGGRFPHRLAINVWQGLEATQPPPGTAGLRSLTIEVPTAEALSTIRRRLAKAAIAYELRGGTLSVSDPAGNPLRIAATSAREPEFR